MSETYYTVGKIVNTHGIRGEVRVIATTDFPAQRFAPGSTLYLFTSDEKPVPLIVERYRPQKNLHLLQFRGYHEINLVEPWKGAELKIVAAQREPLPEGEYYFDEIIGLPVVTEEGEEVGSIKEILQPGANDVWVVERKGKKDLLLPYIDECIKRVDLKQRRVVVSLMEGLDE